MKSFMASLLGSLIVTFLQGTVAEAAVIDDTPLVPAVFTHSTKALHEMTFITAHNAHSSKALTGFCFGNQHYDMYTLMETYNVRGLAIDVIRHNGKLMLAHTFHNLVPDFTGEYVDRMNNEIATFLNDYPDAVLYFDIQVDGFDENDTADMEEMADYFQTAFEDTPDISDRVFNINAWLEWDDWPTLGELVAADERVILTIDKEYLAGVYSVNGRDLHVMFKQDMTMENMFSEADPLSCEERFHMGEQSTALAELNSVGQWTRLFYMNQFGSADGNCDHSADGDNSFDAVTTKAKTCYGYSGLRKPNLISVDWIDGHGYSGTDVDSISGFFNDNSALEDFLEDGLSKIMFYEGNDCSQNFIYEMTAPAAGTTAVATGDQFTNDEIRSAMFVGPLPLGLRLTVCDSDTCNPTDDVSILVVEEEFTGSICVTTFNADTYFSGIRQTWSDDNGNYLDGKVSRLELYLPSNSDMTTKVAASPEWSDYFSEEDGGVSDYGVPIVGLWCSGNNCDNKRLLRAKDSTCKGTYSGWTDYTSEEDNVWLCCGDDEYAGKMQCKGRKCDNIRLGCYKFPSECSYTGNWKNAEVKKKSWWYGDEGEVLQCIKCINDDGYCGQIRTGSKVVVVNDE